MGSSSRFVPGAALAGIVFMAACANAPVAPLADASDPHFAIEIQTEKPQYHLRPGDGTIPTILEPIRAHLRNESTAPVFILVPSEIVSLEKHEDGEWRNLGVWYATLAVAGRVQTIEPGAELSPAAQINLTDPLIEGPGTYRFRFELYATGSPLLRDLLPLESRVSNAFAILD